MAWNLLRQGLGVQADEEQALQHFIKYSRNTYSGILQLANIYYNDENYEKAFKYYILLLDLAENSSVLNVIGEMYLDGKGVNQDKAKAVQYFLKALEGSKRMLDEGLRVILNLLDCYLKGNGVPQDINKAIEYFKVYRDRVCEILSTNTTQFYLMSIYMKSRAEVINIKSSSQISDDEVKDILLNGKWDNFYRRRQKHRELPNQLGKKDMELI